MISYYKCYTCSYLIDSSKTDTYEHLYKDHKQFDVYCFKCKDKDMKVLKERRTNSISLIVETKDGDIYIDNKLVRLSNDIPNYKKYDKKSYFHIDCINCKTEIRTNRNNILNNIKTHMTSRTHKREARRI